MSHLAPKERATKDDFKNGLSVPGLNKLERDMSEYPATILGDLAFRFRELYWRDRMCPRPTSRQLAQTAHLVGRLAREIRSVPVYQRSPEELELLNYLVTPRGVWPEARPFHHATKQIVGEYFCESGKAISSIFHRAWTKSTTSLRAYHLQQIALNLCTTDESYKQVLTIVGAAIPAPRHYKVSAALSGGAFALISICGEFGDRRTNKLLLTAGINSLSAAESTERLFVVDPLARPTEYRFTSFCFSDLLRAHCGVLTTKLGHPWSPTSEEAIDITRSWFEGGHYPIGNFFANCLAIGEDRHVLTFKKLFHQNGIRNINRLKLSDCDDPWFLARHLAERSADDVAGKDVILVAMSSGDHNDAYSERSWELEGIRVAGEDQGWSLDYVEVRDNTELAYHILRHHERGSRVAVLHQLGHGCSEGAEFGHLEREQRSVLSTPQLCTDRDAVELCAIAREAVDTWVVHGCSSAAENRESRRRLSNFAHALYEALDRDVTVRGLRGQDAFDELAHRRGPDNRVLFTGKPVWFGSKTWKGERHGLTATP